MRSKLDDLSRLVVVRWIWEEYRDEPGRRAFVVEVPAGGAEAWLDDVDSDRAHEYWTQVAQVSLSLPGAVTPGHVTCIVDGMGAVLESWVHPMFPYSGLWNGYSPLRRLGVVVPSLHDVAAIPEDVCRRAIEQGPASTECLSPDAWAETELASFLSDSQDE